jgi:GH15 family glucan-1,4-alpha-glucosidase
MLFFMFQPIEDYGLIGDMHTVALVGKNGSLDWLCLPDFDSPSVFARILDQEKGGFFQISPVDAYTTKQVYWPESNVLVTQFLADHGVVELIDFMPVANGGPSHRSRVIRQVRGIRGKMTLQMTCQPALDYARSSHRLELSSQSARFLHPDWQLELVTTVDLSAAGNAVTATFEVKDSEEVVCIFRSHDPSHGEEETCASVAAEKGFRHTVDYWRQWLSQCTYTGRWREMVYRSALTLKLLTYAPTGAIVAAPTCSLPETIGGERNWDYRYTWIRDAAFTIYAFLRIGFTEEAAQFMAWVEARIADLNPDGSLQIMYGIDGRKELPEMMLDHLGGYRDSQPVRVGNGAYQQLQLDIYGELMDAVYLSNKYSAPISYSFWTNLRRLINWVCDHWQQPDEGIWEVRGGQRHFVYSKMMCWVCVDRGLRLADKRSFPADRDRWIEVRDTIYEEIMERGWSEARQSFVQAYDSEALDASTLTMPLVLFMAANDPRMIATLDAILKPIREGGLVSNDLVYRYDVTQTPDGLDGGEGTFNICTFWLVEALTRAGKIYPDRLQDARLMFEHMLSYANHLGLYAEETGPCGDALGNFPQAFTHLALISSAYNLDRALDGR